MINQRHVNTILSYFAGFGASDIDKISKDFSREIILTDWIDTWTGKSEVTEAIQSLLDKVSIIIVPEKIIWSSDDSGIFATCMIDIYAGNSRDRVVDIIHLNHAGNIMSINAYKQ
jgi:hypothetical protein